MDSWSITSQSGISSSPARTFFLLFLFFQMGFFILFILGGSPYPILLILLGCYLLYKIAFSVQHTIFLVCFYIIVLPDYGWGKHYPFFKIFVSYQVVTALIFMAVLFWWAKTALHRKGIMHLTALDKTVLAFLLVILLSAFIGFLKGHPTKYIYKEFYFLSLYSIYFIVVKGVTDPNWVKQFWQLLVISTLVASLQYLFVTLSEVSVGELLIARVTTQQPHLAQLVIPYLASFFLFSASHTKKIFAFMLSVPILVMVFLSQQRSLWVGVPFSIFLLWIFSLFRKRITLRALAKAIPGALFFIFLLIALLLFLDKLFAGSTVATLAVRFETLLRVAEDQSALARMAEINIALEQWRGDILFGTGLGATIHRVATHMIYDVLDNSYAFILWKAGLLGLLSYVLMIVLFYQRGIAIFRKSGDTYQRIVASALSGFAGLMLIALTNSSLMLYRFIIIWAVLFGSLEFLYSRLRNGDKAILETLQE